MEVNQRKILFLANFLWAMSEGNLVEADEILVTHIVSGYLSFGISYGARRGAKKLGQYLLGPLADLPVIGDYIITCPEDKIMQRSSKLIADGVSVIGTATTEYVAPDLALGAAGQVCGQALNEYSNLCYVFRLKFFISKNCSFNTDANGTYATFISSNAFTTCSF